MKTLERKERSASLGTAELSELARQMAELAHGEGLKEITLEAGGHSLRVRRNLLASLSLPEDSVEPSEEAPESAEDEAMGVPVTSLVVGVFRSQPAVHAGQEVKQGQVVGLIESVSLKHEVHCPVNGMVAELLAEDGDPVEYGQALMVLRPAEANL